MWIVAISGWAVAVWILLQRTTRTGTTDTEAQLQQTMREYAYARKAWREEKEQLVSGHRAQIDAIRASAIDLDFGATLDETAVRKLVNEILDKTKTRGERG